MSRSLVRVGVHLIWSTKYRHPWLQPVVREQLVQVLSKVVEHQGCTAVAIGGWVDHLHVYLLLSPRVALAALIAIVKANTARWVRLNAPGLADFEWQRGYAAFSVDPRDDAALCAYILAQEKIHGGRDAQVSSRERGSFVGRGGRDPTPPSRPQSGDGNEPSQSPVWRTNKNGPTPRVSPSSLPTPSATGSATAAAT